MLEVSEAEIQARLKFDNPWWEDEGVPFVQMPRRKYFQPFIHQVCDRSINRAVVLMGPRRVGKTVMVYHSIDELLRHDVAAPREVLYLSLETPLYTGLSLEKILNMFLRMFGHKKTTPLYVFFDEVQYLRDWEVHLKSLVDSYPDYRFVATGSAAAALRLKSHESGAGRFTDFVLPPLTFAEYLQFIKREDELIESRVHDRSNQKLPPVHEYIPKDIQALNAEFINYLNFGGYPEAVFSETIRSDTARYIKSDIVDKVLLRDLPSLYGISDIQELNRLFTTLAYNTGLEVSLEDLSRSAGVAKNTIKRYLEYLEAAFLIKRVNRIDRSAKRFERIMCFKVYLTNPSMRAALFGQVPPDSEAMGNLTETAIFSQWQHSTISHLYYARWNSGEIDIVSLSGREQKPLWAVEVKWSDRPVTDFSLLRHCVAFAETHPKLAQPIMVTTKTIQAAKEYQGIKFRFVPSSLYAYMLGANLLRHMTVEDALEVDELEPEESSSEED